MSDTKKYLVARGPFRLPSPVIEEGSIIDLDPAVAAQFVREGTLNPSGFECDDGGNPIDADAKAKADADAAQAAADAKAQADADATAAAQADADAKAKADADAQPKVGDACKMDDGSDGVLQENADGSGTLVCAPASGE